MMRNAKIGDVATDLDVSLQTVRNWLKLGDEYFSESATRPTGKRFTPSDIQQLQTIKSLLADGLTYEDIPTRLSPAPQVVEILDDHQEPPTTNQDATSALQTLELMQYINDMLEQQQKTYNQTINAKDETIQVLKDEIERLRRPWWKRLF